MTSKNTFWALRDHLPILLLDTAEKYKKLDSGSVDREQLLEGAKFLFEFLFSAIEANSKQLFRWNTAWAAVMLTKSGITADIIPPFYQAARTVLCDTSKSGILDHPLRRRLDDFLDAGIEVLQQPAQALFAAPLENPYRNQQDTFMSYVLSGDKNSAVSFILGLYQMGVPLKDIYELILRPSQDEIGVLWFDKKITIIKEHYATAVTQLLMTLLFDRAVKAPTAGKKFMAALVQGEYHDCGMRMVYDYMTCQGWDTYFAANLPLRELLILMEIQMPDILGISCTMAFNLHLVIELITEVRRRGFPSKIVVGGLPFRIDENLWNNVGADAFAPDLEACLTISEQLRCGN